MSPDLITVAHARRLVLGAAAEVHLPSGEVPVMAALDRTLAADVSATGDVPPFACSAMDGYAIVAGTAGRALTLAGESRAGRPSNTPLPSHAHAIRISTGAALPAGADAVIRQEDVSLEDGRVVTGEQTTSGANVRGAGEDMRGGTTVLQAGTRLGVAELGAAVTAGAKTLRVAAPPRVAILSTGDELRAPGELLGPGQIHNSNAVTLTALAQRAGAVVTRADPVPDDRGATEAAFADALGESDVLVVSGGVSVGPHDHVKPALAALGVRERFWGVALQPGKPTWFGTRGDRLVLGLPGNPVSAYVTFVLFALPALRALQGGPDGEGGPLTAELDVPVSRNRGREQAIRVRLDRSGGRLTATPTGPQGSHLITSLLGADALALIPPGAEPLPAGTQVPLVPLRN